MLIVSIILSKLVQRVITPGHVLYRSLFALFLIFLLSQAGIDNYLCHCGRLALVRHLGSPVHYNNCSAFVSWEDGTSSFNPSVIKIALGGDIHPQPGPSSTALRGSPTARTVASEMNVFPKNAHLDIN